MEMDKPGDVAEGILPMKALHGNLHRSGKGRGDAHECRLCGLRGEQ